jgi:cytochrome c biogenesis protein CcmG/thiol:disulfide interchange protein DsbE
METAMKMLRPVLVVTASLLSVPPAFSDAIEPNARKAAPDFTLVAADGKRVSLAGLKGKVVLLDFWATWCTGCKEEMPWFMEFQNTYGRRGLQSVGVAMDVEGWAKVRPYLKEHPINYPTVVGDLAFANRFGSVVALPVTLLIDRKGRIAEFHNGKVEKDAFEANLRRLLAEKP